MLTTRVKVLGTVDGEKAVTMTIDCLCPLRTVEEICMALRNSLNGMGSSINFEILFTDEDI
jgi:hypothetical protein